MAELNFTNVADLYEYVVRNGPVFFEKSGVDYATTSQQIINSKTQYSYRSCGVEFHTDGIIIGARGMISGRNKGNDTLYFDNVANIDEDIGLLFHSVRLYTKGGSGIYILRGAKHVLVLEAVKYFYHQYMNNKTNEAAQNYEANPSAMDELKKASELFNNGLITEDEFKAIKSKLLKDL